MPQGMNMNPPLYNPMQQMQQGQNQIQNPAPIAQTQQNN